MRLAVARHARAAGSGKPRRWGTLGDNDETGYAYIGFYSGENATAANRPQLIVTYQ